MAEDLINSILDRQKVKPEIAETIADLEKLQKQLFDTTNGAVALTAAIGKASTPKEFTAAITKANNELEKTVKIREKISQTIVSNSQAEVDAYNKTIAGEKGITSTINERDKAQAKAANNATAGGAKVLAQQQAQAKEYTRAQGLIERLREKLVAYRAIQSDTANPKTLIEYNKKIQNTQAMITQLSNAGKDGFDSLGNAVKKSGNAFQSIGQKVVTLARLLPGIGIIGLISFATQPIIDYITQLDIFKAKIATIAADTAIDSSDFKDALSAVNSLKTSIEEFNTGTISGKLLVERYNETIGKTAGILTTTAEVEDFYNRKADAYVQAMFLRAQANAALQASTDKLAEAQKRAIDGVTGGDTFKAIFSNFGSSLKGFFTGDYSKIALGAVDNQQKAVDKLNKQGKDGLRLFDEIKKQSDAFNKANGFGDLDGAKRDAEAKKAADEAKRRAKELKAIAEASARELLELQNEYEKQIADAQKRGEKAEADRLKEILKNSESVFEQANSQRLLQIEQNQSEALALVAEQYAKGILSEKEYQREKYEIEFESNKESIESAIQLSQSLIELRKSQGEELGIEEEKLAKLQIKLSELVTGKKLADADKVQARQKELNGKIKELAEEAAQFVITLVDAGFENRKNKLQEEAVAIDENTAAQIKQVERSVGTEQEKADKISVINAKAQSDKQRIANQQKQIDIEKAKFDKAVAIAGIIQNTALAVVKALPNPVLAALVGAIGAIQLATAIAQPIPTYKDGTESHKGGWAIFGEAGTEAVIEPGKKPYLTQGATMGILPAGTQVISNADLMSAMANPSGGNSYVSNQLDLSAMIVESRNSTDKIVKALQVKQSANYRIGVRDGKKFNDYLKRNIN